MYRHAHILVLALMYLAVSPTIAANSNHPLLLEMGIDISQEHGPIYLARSPGPVPESTAYRILGTRRDVSVVAGDPAAIEALRLQGFVVGELPDSRLSLAPMPLPVVPPTEADPAIQSMVNQMTWASLETKINWLTAFGTRNSYTPQCAAAAESLQIFFADLGLASARRPFEYNATTMYNVVATQTGTTFPEIVVIICGHYDSTSPQYMTDAPGADDNGTGTAVVMACAEILSQYQFQYTVKYVCFAGEEQYLRGSAAFAQAAANAGERIVAVLNFDMIGYGDTGVELDLEIETNNASMSLANVVTAAADVYTTAAYELHVDDNAYWGDHYSFWLQGFPAINHEEAWDWGDPDFNPYYHSNQDVIDHIDPGFMEDNGQVAVASLATLAVPDRTVGVPDTPKSLVLSASPNPFNGRVQFLIEGVDGIVELDIYDLRGRMVRSLQGGTVGGPSRLDWDGIDNWGQSVGSGSYLCRVRGRDPQKTVRVVYLK